MPTLPPILKKLFPQKVKLFINGVWIMTQMLQLKKLYDLGPVQLNPPRITSIYYRMESIYAAVYPFKERRWGWGL
jgi:hypothetical protein